MDKEMFLIANWDQECRADYLQSAYNLKANALEGTMPRNRKGMDVINELVLKTERDDGKIYFSYFY